MEGDLQRTFGYSVRRLRLARGLSQEQLAELLHVHRTFVGSVERGERNLTLRTVERLSSQLDADPVFLLSAVDPGGEGTGLRAAADGRDPGPPRRPAGSARARPRGRA